LADGVEINHGGFLKVIMIPDEDLKIPLGFDDKKADNMILATAKQIARRSEMPTILVSKDINVRVKANSLGIQAQDYTNDKIKLEKYSKNIFDIEVSGEDYNFFSEKGSLKIQSFDLKAQLHENQFVSINHKDDNLLGRVYLDEGLIKRLKIKQKDTIFGIKALNAEQLMALDILMDNEIKLVSLIGVAGTGKTLLALATALQKVLKEEKYTKLLISRPTIVMGSDIGFLPGSKEEKMKPWLQPIYDNLEFLFKGKNVNGEDYINKKSAIEVEVLSYIRGRSIPDQFIIVDEAQNLTPHEIKTILTRVGDNTKIVLTGDPYQIDNPYLDSSSNGLVYAMDKFKGKKIAANVTLTVGERSELASLAAKLL
jgi:PhoH-like ATPase